MRFAFIVDPLDTLKAAKDSSIAMMRAAQDAGHAVWAIVQPAIHWNALHGVCADAVHLELLDDDSDWCVEVDRHAAVPLRDFAAVVMRKDPPFDIEYVTTTWLLEQAQAEGARVVNAPRALRDHSEKLAILEFPQFIAPTLVAREAAQAGWLPGQQRQQRAGKHHGGAPQRVQAMPVQRLEADPGQAPDQRIAQQGQRRQRGRF